ncbi:MAG: hypothetical protein QG588_1286, partial [Candidatus Poribacteria bacterium]|nr:hypothetical protein [Candidatus Poribacteria bacterium]
GSVASKKIATSCAKALIVKNIQKVIEKIKLIILKYPFNQVIIGVEELGTNENAL